MVVIANETMMFGYRSSGALGSPFFIQESEPTNSTIETSNQKGTPMSNTSTRGASATSTKTTTADEMTVVHTFVKNAFEEVRAYLQPYKGGQLAHIRVFTPDKNDVDRPTKKGIALNIRDLPKLAQAVDALLAATEASRT
jgi:hypothetical protein